MNVAGFFFLRDPMDKIVYVPSVQLWYPVITGSTNPFYTWTHILQVQEQRAVRDTLLNCLMYNTLFHEFLSKLMSHSSQKYPLVFEQKKPDTETQEQAKLT